MLDDRKLTSRDAVGIPHPKAGEGSGRGLDRVEMLHPVGRRPGRVRSSAPESRYSAEPFIS